jgi:hypothetical protein
VINAPTSTSLLIDQQRIEEVKRFVYLGITLKYDEDIEADVNCRVGIASAVFQKMRHIWPTATIDMKTKIGLFNAIVIPTAIYSRETWKTTTKITRKLNVFQQRCLRKILRITHRDRITNEEVLHRSETPKLEDIVAKRRLLLAGHVLRSLEVRHPKTAIQWIPPGGKQKRGRPHKT